jgi:hypothetical protein
MSKSIHFFATKRDLEAVLEAVESQRPIKYVEAGMFDKPETRTVSTGLQIPNLGFAPSGTNVGEPFWLVIDAEAKVEVETVPQRRGGTRYSIDPRLNPESVVVWPGGVFNEAAVIAGQFATAMTNSTSMELQGMFVREIRRQFKRIKSFSVGPEAEQLFNAGYRLTSSVKSPSETDLSWD